MLFIIKRWVSRELFNVTNQELEVGNLECDIVNGSVTQDQRHQLYCLHSHLLIFGGEILEDGVKELNSALPVDVADKPFEAVENKDLASTLNYLGVIGLNVAVYAVDYPVALLFKLLEDDLRVVLTENHDLLES